MIERAAIDGKDYRPHDEAEDSRRCAKFHFSKLSIAVSFLIFPIHLPQLLIARRHFEQQRERRERAFSFVKCDRLDHSSIRSAPIS
jgi:hypothetical protein